MQVLFFQDSLSYRSKSIIKQFKHLDVEVANDQTFEWYWVIIHLKSGARDT